MVLLGSCCGDAVDCVSLLGEKFGGGGGTTDGSLTFYGLIGFDDGGQMVVD